MTRAKSEVVQISMANLDAIAALGVAVPRYERSRLTPRILHIGVGGFHRAHMAPYTDQLASRASDWGICGVGLLASDLKMAMTLRSQDHLYALIEHDSGSTSVSVVGSIVDFALVAGDEEAFARKVSDPDLAIISLTITEGGYSLRDPNATIATIVSALETRLDAAAGPLTILSCDNLPGNGDAARDAILTVAAGHSPQLADRIDSMCTFPNSMVDRITPQTTDADRRWLRELGIEDGWPVVCEPFRQWVIEDNFAAGRPGWEEVGVLFSDRVHDWELYKLRMLNAAHSCMAYLSALAGIAYVDEAIATPEVSAYLRRLLSTEAIPTLREIPGYPAAKYAESIFQRFANTGIRDQIARLCIDGTTKFQSFLLPTIEAQLQRDGPIACASLALAGWARYLGIVPAQQRAPDPHADEAAALAQDALTDPIVFLELDIFSDRLRTSNRFREAFAASCLQLDARGPLGAIGGLLG
jgi:mannitol 2-dehydrogenase